MLITKHTYLNKNIKYMRNMLIREYDLVDGGFSIIKKNKLLPDHEIEKISKMDKMAKNIYIGKLYFKYKKLSKELLNGFTEARELLYKKNNFKDEDILSIKKDAVFLIDVRLNNLELNEYYKFSMKNKYTSYMYLNNLELYYSSYDDSLSVKGISDDNLNRHKNGILIDIKRFIRLNENLNVNKNILFNKFLDLTNKYKNGQLNIDYYREFNFISMYKSNILENMYLEYCNDVTDIDISYNYNVLLNLIRNII